MEFSVDLPDVFPDGPIVVDDEVHEYEVYDDGTSKTSYTLDKAGDGSITKIESVTGQYNGISNNEFVNGTDYELSSGDIVWLNGDRPDDNTRFYVTYRTESILTRYTAAGEEQLSEAEESVVESINAKFIDEAEGRELDELGKLFGPVIGKRRGRVDPVYRIYLKSIVQSFISRGTKSGIRAAVAAAIGLEPSDVEIREDFENSSYEVVLPAISAHAASTVEDIAEIADPSGIEQELTRYNLPPDTMGIDDGITTRRGFSISDEFGVTDSFTVDPATTSLSESLGLDDAVAEETPTSVDETGGIDDTIAVEEIVIAWDLGNWDSMHWN